MSDIETAPVAAPVEASDDSVSRFSPEVRALMQAAAKPESEPDHAQSDSEPTGEQMAAPAADETASEQAQPEPPAQPEHEAAWEHIDKAAASLEQRAQELAKAERKFAAFSRAQELADDSIAEAFRQFIRASQGLEDDANVDAQFADWLSEINIEVAGELAPIEARYKVVERKGQRIKGQHERRLKAEQAAREREQAELSEKGQREAALAKVRELVSLDAYPHLGLVKGWESQVFDEANKIYTRTGQAPNVQEIAKRLEQATAAEYAEALKRFTKPAQPSTPPPPAKASNQTVATSKPAPRAKQEAVTTEGPEGSWSRDNARAAALDKFRTLKRA